MVIQIFTVKITIILTILPSNLPKESHCFPDKTAEAQRGLAGSQGHTAMDGTEPGLKSGPMCL